jgi:hypothetical protein
VEQQEQPGAGRPARAIRVVRLPAATQQLLQDIAARQTRLEAGQTRLDRRMDQMEDMMRWLVRDAQERSRAAGLASEPLPPPRQYPDDGADGAGPA